MIQYLQSKADELTELGERARRRAVRVFRGHPDRFLATCKGVVHVGANMGQEARIYANLGLSVLWIEPIPEIFESLVLNIHAYPRQYALNALITDKDNETHTFHVANNGGQSSSILDLHQHKDIWPDIDYVKHITCVSKTLPTAMRAANVDAAEFDALVMDTQGSELLVLRGAAEMLREFRYIKTEAADFEVYKGCATITSLRDYLSRVGFEMIRKDRFARRRSGGGCFDALFVNRSFGRGGMITG